MAFFSVKRYTGEEDKSTAENKAENILQKLHEAAEQRRRSREFGAVGNDLLENVSKEKSSSKKRKQVLESKTDHGSSEDNEDVKKKKKWKLNKTRDQTEDSRDESDVKDEECSKADDELKETINEDILNDEDVCSERLTDEAGLRESSDKEHRTEEDEKSVCENVNSEPQPKEAAFSVLGQFRGKKPQMVHRVLPDWLDKPTVITDDLRHKRVPFDDVKGIDPRLLEKLRENGIKDFFPVQGALLPELLRSFQFGYLFGDAGFRPSDICCSAPTGSGKTLAYVLPIIQVLSQRVVPQLRALVILPVRDLVKQVYNVFQTYCKDSSVKVVHITGFKTFSSEQKLLVRKGPCGFESQCDILISTPGRLVSHINKTAGFTLKHLRFLIIDEADRMMDEIKNDWLRHVEDAMYSANDPQSPNDPHSAIDPYSANDPHSAKEQNGIFGDIQRCAPGPMTASSACKPQLVLQKLLFSATLSQNPEKLQRLGLFQPKLFTSVVHSKQKRDTLAADTKKKTEGEFIGKFTTPAGLTELFIETKPGEKPLVMMRFIQHLRYKHVLCFTNSVDTAHRLYWLIKLTCDVQVREISSRQHTEKRKKILKQFAEGKVDVLVCTDALARGMDIENVRYVISYECPAYLKTYIHRAGRTARAGKVGTAITLLERKEIFRFKQMMKEAGKSDLKERRVKISELKPFVSSYRKALDELQQILNAEVQKSGNA